MTLAPDSQLHELALQAGTTLTAREEIVATAESCTGGWIAKILTDIAGSSAWFERGFVTYSNQAKTQLLGVDEVLLQRHGAVSRQVVEAMAIGALSGGADWSIASSGIAGPGGGCEDKPVGIVWLAWANVHASGARASSQRYLFDGDRESVRRQAVALALQGLLERI